MRLRTPAGLSPPFCPYSQPSRDPPPLGLAIEQADPTGLSYVSPADACGLANPKAVAGIEDSEGEDGKVCLGAHGRGHGAEHTQGAPDVLTKLGVVCPTRSGRNGPMDGAHTDTVGRSSWSFSA